MGKSGFSTEAFADTGGEVVGFIDQEEDAVGGEAFLLQQEGAVAGGEDVVEVADEDVCIGKGGAGDFVGADPGTRTEVADFTQGGRPLAEKFGRLDAGAFPLFLKVAAAIAAVASVEGRLDGMFLAVAQLEEAGR